MVENVEVSLEEHNEQVLRDGVTDVKSYLNEDVFCASIYQCEKGVWVVEVLSRTKKTLERKSFNNLKDADVFFDEVSR